MFQEFLSEVKESITPLAISTAICAVGVTFFWSLPANAQSFSCANADRPAEFAVCNDENLLLLDEKLGQIFAAVYVQASNEPKRQAVAREQNEWLRSRNSCGNDFTCLNLRYQERINNLAKNS